MKERRTVAGLVLILQLFLNSSCAFIQVGIARDFNRYTVSGELQPGMSKEEARKILGSPESVASRKTAVDVRSVWTYSQPKLRSPAAYFLLGVLTFGIFWLFPAMDMEYHYVVFSDDTLVGWDLKDPYAPDLIIEKRER